MVNEKILSVIIVTYNNELTICDCLESIQKFNDIGASLEVIVVDNGSKDNTQEIIKKYGDFITFIPSKNNGFGAGNNLGVKNSHGKYLFLLNPDTILVEPIFSIIINQLEKKDNSVGGFHLVSRKNKDMPSFGFLPEKINFPLYSKILYFVLRKRTIKLSFSYPWGADLFLASENFNKVNGFDEEFFLNFEELVLMKKLNVPLTIIHPEKIVHLESVSKPKGKESLNFYFNSEKLFFDKYCKNQTYNTYRDRIKTKLLLKKIFYGMLGKELSEFELEQLKRYK